MRKSLEEAYDFLKPLIKALSMALGQNCEIVLHDLYNLEHSIVAIENGHITGRKIGDSSTNLGLEILRKGALENNFLNYTSRTKDGKVLRSSSVYVRNDEGLVIACICINYNITDFMMAANTLNDFIRTSDEVDETFVGDIGDVIEKILEDGIKAIGKHVPFMQKEDKLRFLEYVEEKGIFEVKRSTEMVAAFLDVSKFIIYNYLDELRQLKRTEKHSLE